VDYFLEDLPEDLEPKLQNGSVDMPKDVQALSSIYGKNGSQDIWRVVYFDNKYTFHASKTAISLLNIQLVEFVREFTSED
jgi:hypothetical protein